MKKSIDVSAPVTTRAGKPYTEAKTDDGKIVLVDGRTKRADQIVGTDEIMMEEIPIGRLLIMALDANDDSISAAERRKRFRLSCQIEQAIQDKAPFEFDTEDRKTLEAAADLIKNHFFLTRIYEAIEGAEVVEKPRVRVPNGKAEAAPPAN